MPGSKIGGKKAAQTMIRKYGLDVYKRLGAIGGSKSRGGGFTAETGKVYGTIGGSISRRGTANKLNKTERQAARKRALQRVQEHQERKEIYTRLMKQRRELSAMQTSKLSQKFGVKRSW